MIRVENVGDDRAARHQDQFAQKVDDFVLRVTQTLFGEIESGGRYSPGTPVRSGFTRGNWNRYPTTPRAGDLAVTENRVPWIRRLEFGFIGRDALGRYYTGFGPRSVGGRSSQAPEGFVRIALANAPALVDEVRAHVFGAA